VKRIKGFDGLRALAVTCVFFGHMRPVDMPLGTVAVYTFFVLSGFLITGILTDQRMRVEQGDAGPGGEMLRFYWRRSLRIFPIYYLVLALYLGFIWHDSGAAPAGWWAFVLYLSNIWMAPQASCHYLLCHFWSLAVEEQFYVLLAPLLLYVPSRWHLGIVASVFALGTASLFSAPGLGLTPHEQYWLSTTNFSLLSAGGLVALLHRQQPGWRLPGCSGAVAALVVMAFLLGSNRLRAFSLPLYLLHLWATVASLAVVLDWVVRHQASRMVRWLEWRPAAYLGVVSYSFYLIHPATIHLYRAYVQWPDALTAHASKNGLAAINAVLCFAATFAISHVSWVVFERRVLHLRDAFEPSKPAGPPARVPAPG